MLAYRRIIIVGGGTSGWMTAAALCNTPAFNQSKITLIESKQIGTIGVGEGSTPYLKRFMEQLGFDEISWMRACDATYKTGIKFTHWNNDKSHYFHPFYTAIDVKAAEVFFNQANARRRGQGEQVNGDDYFVASLLARDNCLPVPVKTYPVTNEYGFHFNASKLAKLLADFSRSKGVDVIDAKVEKVNQLPSGDIDSLILDDGACHQADLFIDCTGFKGLLINQISPNQFTSFKQDLLNDSAVTISTQDITQKVYTESSAMEAGWRWQIPLTSRTGYGYVYSSEHKSPEQAEQELVTSLNIQGGVQCRHLSMKVGQQNKAWVGNVLAVGLSQSFIEPLEATALMVTQFSIESFIKAHVGQSITNEQNRNQFNAELSKLIYGVKDYILAHYLTSKRRENLYWQSVTDIDKADTRLEAILAAWSSGADFDACLNHYENELAYFRPSWYALLAGMDYRNDQLVVPHQTVSADIIEAAKKYTHDLYRHFYQVRQYSL
ncbi:tryptophan 7-halogenase [Catenovulum sp. SM1970]|uniref:tryptophan halogenase family protein n=1 Tax=Marinifaba aquimaris TaxID=2741323 RepID=UPI001572C7CF|nr:tryptophan halogenase family protein [Marinifaba aquimaris]NTS76027.1 tryptophan 7-halogenase [Marinifaba aquimaris]